MKERIMNEWRSKHKYRINTSNSNNSSKRRLWTSNDPGYISADSNPKLGIGASCYIIPLLMWLKYIPIEQLMVMQSELMYGNNHNNFLSDVRCWFALEYEYETMNQCRKDKKKMVEIEKEHHTKSARNKVKDNEARQLYDGLYKWCNKRLFELLNLDQYKKILLHEIKWEEWYS